MGTNIDRAGDDKGTGYITFYFDKPVLNPVLDLDRMGGDGRVSNKATTNSAILTLLNSDLSLTKLSGNSQFQVTSKTIERTPNQKFSQFNQEASWAANSAGAGSVMIKGIISSVSFKWTGTGIEGMGQDGIELVWDLTEYVDNTAPVVTSSLSRNMVRSGDNLTVNAQSSSDTSYIVANVMGNLYSMNKGSGNNWNLNFTVPDAADGVYTVLLGAFDGMGNMGTSIMNFTVDNTAPTINASCNPVLTRTGNSVLVNATADDDTASMTLEVLGTIYNMIKDTDGNWIFNYAVPGLADGTYDMLLTATDALGNTGNNYLNFTVDNTAPALVGDLNQTTIRTGDNLTLNVSADNDTDTLTATILGKVYNLTKGSDGFWTLQYLVPQVADGLYTIILTGTDALGNMGNTSLNFTVDNTAPSINGSVLPGLTKTGNSVLVKVVSDPDTVRMTATILGTTYNMIQGPDGIWTLQYTVPQVADGLLQVILDAWDGASNHGFNTTNMTVDNALPGVNCTVLPGRAKNGTDITLRVFADSDVVNVTALLAGNHYNLTQNSDGTWTLKYSVQGLADGFQTVLLTATNGLGSQGTAYTGFTVDNTAPALNAEVLPFTVRDGGKLFVRVYSDVDAVVVTAEILGKTYNLIKGSNSIWTLTYTVPGLKDGNYNVMLRGWDDLNNTNNTTVTFKVQNPVTPVNHGSLGGSSGSSTSTVHSGVQSYYSSVLGVKSGSLGLGSFSSVDSRGTVKGVNLQSSMVVQDPVLKSILAKIEAKGLKSQNGLLLSKNKNPFGLNGNEQSWLKLHLNDQGVKNALYTNGIKYFKDNPWAGWVILGLMMVLVGELTLGAGDLTFIPFIGAEATETSAATTGAEAAETGIIARIIQLGSNNALYMMWRLSQVGISPGAILTALSPDVLGVMMTFLEFLAPRSSVVSEVVESLSYKFLAQQLGAYTLVEFLREPGAAWRGIVDSASSLIVTAKAAVKRRLQSFANDMVSKAKKRIYYC